MSHALQWLRTLKEGDVITIIWRNVPEDVVVVKAYNPKRQLTCVRIKRKHLAQFVYLTAVGDYVSCRFSNHQGNEHLDYTRWLVNQQPIAPPS